MITNRYFYRISQIIILIATVIASKILHMRQQNFNQQINQILNKIYSYAKIITLYLKNLWKVTNNQIQIDGVTLWSGKIASRLIQMKNTMNLRLTTKNTCN